MVDLKGNLAKSAIEDLRDWDETLRVSGFQAFHRESANILSSEPSPIKTKH
jgi:hypothetical protein